MDGEIRGNQVTSRRRGATLDVTLACSHSIKLTQFDTPYNFGIPEAYHRHKANHWHVTAETVEKSKKTRIAAVMAVYDDGEKFNVKLQHINSWLGATSAGDFGKAEGWIRFDQSDTLPSRLADENVIQRTNIWGRDRDGEIFSV